MVGDPMVERIPPGTWVEIGAIVLPPAARAPHLPEDTRQVALEMRTKGFLIEPASIGEEAEIETPVGRRMRGTLMQANPAYTHGFGPPIPELRRIGGEVRAALRARKRVR